MLHISRTARLIRNAKMKNYEYEEKSYQTQIKRNMLGPRMRRPAEYITNNTWTKEVTINNTYFSKRKEKDVAVCRKYFRVKLATKYLIAQNNGMICEQNN